MNYFIFPFPLNYSNERDTWFCQLNQIVINDCKITVWFTRQIYAFLPLRIDKMEMQTWNNWFIICPLIWGCHTSVHGGYLPPEKRPFELVVHLFWDTGARDWISHETQTLDGIKDQHDQTTLQNQATDQDLVWRINLKKKNKAFMELNVQEKQYHAP